MSCLQTIKNVAVTEETIRVVARELDLAVHETGDEINLQMEGAYGNIKLRKDEKGNYTITYDSAVSDTAKKVRDCLMQEEAVSQIIQNKNGELNSSGSYQDYLNGQTEELVAVVSW